MFKKKNQQKTNKKESLFTKIKKYFQREKKLDYIETVLTIINYWFLLLR
jgi:hypothetical protein